MKKFWTRTPSQLLLSLSALLILSSCGESTGGEGNGKGGNGEKAIDWQKIQSSAENDPRKKIEFDEYYVKFSIRAMDELRTIPRDSLPWAAGIQQSPQTGNVAHFFLEGDRISLESAHIRADWVYARQPNCGSVDSLFGWLEDFFVHSERKGQIIMPLQTMGTYSGKTAWLEAVHIPQYAETDTTMKAEKWMAWAYVQQKDYWVGWVFSAHSLPMWDRGLPLFKALIGTYEEDEWKGPS